MGALVFQDMADILHSVGMAPFPQLLGKIFSPQPCHHIHVGQAEAGGGIPDFVPEGGEKKSHLAFREVEFRGQPGGHGGVPGQDAAEEFPDAIGRELEIIFSVAVAEGGFIGKESSKSVSEVFSAVKIDLFMDFPEEVAAGLPVQHGDVSGEESGCLRCGLKDEIDAPAAVGEGEGQEAVPLLSCEVDGFGEDFPRFLIHGHGQYLEEPFPLLEERQPQGAMEFSHPVHGVQPEIEGAVFCIFRPSQGVVGTSGGHMGIIDKPQAHSLFLGKGQSRIQHFPPAVRAEPVPSPVFQDGLGNPRLTQGFQGLADHGGGLVGVPKERTKVILGGSGEQGIHGSERKGLTGTAGKRSPCRTRRREGGGSAPPGTMSLPALPGSLREPPPPPWRNRQTFPGGMG